MKNVEQLARTVSMLSVDAVQKANSGHPGLPMGAAGYASLLWANYLRFNPKDPQWLNRDRFVLSAGHGSMLLYSLLNVFGYGVPMSEVQKFRQWESITPGHPEFGMTPGVEATTGPLGQGAGNSVGIALSAKMLSARYGKDLFNYRVFALVSDGDLMEGISQEASSLAGHLELDNLIYLYDDNKISLAGKTDVSFTENVPKRYEGYGWFVQSVNADDLDAVDKCIAAAINEPKRPSIICIRSLIGKGSPNKADTYEVHGSPLGADEVKATKENLKWPLEPSFLIPQDVKAFCDERIATKTEEYQQWKEKFTSWKSSNGDLSKKLEQQISKELPAALKEELAAGLSHTKKEATRSLSGKAIQVIAKHIPWFIGGAADLEPSTKTTIKDGGEIQANQFAGKNIRFGVREHAMGAAVNGLAYCKCWAPFSATFLVFSDYMRPSMRLAALSHLQSLFVFTHDSFWVGEDGPTHEPIEHVQSLRLIPNLYVFRPADGVETGMSYYAALSLKDRPSTLIFTRQDLPPLERPSTFKADDVLKGGYVVYEGAGAKTAIVATGSEVWLAVEAAKQLEGQGVSCRVVSLPCVELFLEQPEAYRNTVLPKTMAKVSIEAGVTFGWKDILGSEALTLGIDHYGASAPGEVLAEKFGFSPESVVKKIKAWVK